MWPLYWACARSSDVQPRNDGDHRLASVFYQHRAVSAPLEEVLLRHEPMGSLCLIA